MADNPSSPATGDTNTKKSGQDNPTAESDPAPVPAPTPPSQLQQQQSTQPQSATPSNSAPVSQPLVPPYALTQISGSAAGVIPPPSPFRPASQFIPISNFLNPSAPTPGVPPPGVSSANVMVAPGSLPQMSPYQVLPGQTPNPTLRPFPHMPNGYAAMPGVALQGTVPAPGLPRYPSPYPAIIRPGFPLRPPSAIGTLPTVPRPPVPGIPGVRPIIPLVVRPAVIPSVTPADKPQTTVYVGKIAPTVENDFMLSLLQFCGSVKSWKRAQDPTTGTPKGFGFYEFESVEGVLRAIRLLSKFNVDGQELMLNVNQATKEYLERYVNKKMENAKTAKASEAEGSKETQAAVSEEEGGKKAVSHEKNESARLFSDESKKDSETGNRENIDIAYSGLVTDEDREADREALEKIKMAIEDRLKTKPLPPPPVNDGSTSEPASKSKDGSYEADVVRGGAAEPRNNDETCSELNRPETSSPDRSRKHDRRSRDRDRERDLNREKEQELERYEREAERERARKEREQRRKMEDAERAYQARLRQWERRERDKEKERQYEKEREKEKERKRKKEIRYDEDEDDDDGSRRRWHRSALEEKRRRRLREKEDDFTDRLKEEEEIAEAKRKAEEEKLQQQQIDALRILSGQSVDRSEKFQASAVEDRDKATFQNDSDSVHKNHSRGGGVVHNGTGNESTVALVNASDARQSNSALAKKLGFGLVGSGKRTAVPSVFHEEDEDETHKDKRMRPLVPIDYSTEEQQAVQHSGSGTTPPHLAAAQEFAKRISNANPKEETSEVEKDKSRRSQDKGSRRDKDRVDGENGLTKDREHGVEKAKTPDNKKLLDAKQLIDTIPKTKDELFSYEINWAIYDKHQLHERMKPWISKKIMEFLGEEETTLVDYIVSNTRGHVKASQMLELLESILDEEAEMFVLKMWRMLIFEIKRVEAGLPVKSKT